MNSQKNSDSIKIHKNEARNAIQAKKDNVTLREQIRETQAGLDTAKAVIREQRDQLQDCENANVYERKMRDLSDRAASAAESENKQLTKQVRKYKRQRTGIAAGGVVLIVLSIIFL